MFLNSTQRNGMSEMQNTLLKAGGSLEAAEDRFMKVAKNPNSSPGDIQFEQMELQKAQRKFEIISKVAEFMHQMMMRIIERLRAQ